MRKSEEIRAQSVTHWFRALMLSGSRDRIGLRIWNATMPTGGS